MLKGSLREGAPDGVGWRSKRNNGVRTFKDVKFLYTRVLLPSFSCENATSLAEGGYSYITPKLNCNVGARIARLKTMKFCETNRLSVILSGAERSRTRRAMRSIGIYNEIQLYLLIKMHSKICYEIPASQALLDLLRCTRKFRLRLRFAQDDTLNENFAKQSINAQNKKHKQNP